MTKPGSRLLHIPWAAFAGLLLLALVSASALLWAGLFGPVEDVDVDTDENGTQVTLHFAYPVQYLYHTPNSEGKVLLIGVRSTDPQAYGPNAPSLRQHVSFNRKLAPMIRDIEYKQEAGFSAYLLIEFEKAERYSVSTLPDSRGFRITIHPPTDSSDTP